MKREQYLNELRREKKRRLAERGKIDKSIAGLERAADAARRQGRNPADVEASIVLLERSLSAIEAEIRQIDININLERKNQ